MATRAPKVLIIDDDPALRSSLAENLQLRGIRVDVAATPEEAKQLLQDHKYQVVTTDIYHTNSPVSGDAFILQNKEQLQQSEVIVFTANPIDYVNHSLQDLKIPILDKGNDLERLIELIEQKLNKPITDHNESNVPAGLKLIQTIDGGAEWIGKIAWSPDGKQLAAQTSSRGVLLWNRETTNATVIDSNPNPRGGITWSPDGRTIAYSSESNVLLYDVRKSTGTRSVSDDASAGELSPGLSWSPDGKTLGVGNRKGAVSVYATDDWSLRTHFESDNDWIFSLAWSPSSTVLASGGDDNILRLWDLPSEKHRELIGHTDQITCITWSPYDDLLASGSADKSVRIWDPLSNQHLKTLEGHSARITSISFSYDGSLLASKSNDGTVKLWRAGTWDLITTIEEQAEIPGGLYTPGIAFHPHELVLATLGDENANVRIWKLQANLLLRPDEESILSASVSDQPTPTDSLGFEPYVRALARFLTDERTQPPLTLSIEGEWGSGKSSFMLQLEDELKRPAQQQRIKKLLKVRWIIRMRKERIPTPIRHRRWWGGLWPLLALPREERHPTFLSVRFNAWRHDKESSLWASFAMELLRKLPKELPPFLRLWAYLKLNSRRFKWSDGWLPLLRSMLIAVTFAALSSIVVYLLYTGGIEKLIGEISAAKGDILLTLIKTSGIFGCLLAFLYLLIKLKETIGDPFKSDLKKYLQTPGYDNQIAFVEQFHEDFGKIIESFAGKNNVYVFIDDLDRCEVPKAADLMQAINLLISDSPQVFFIVGMDREKVAAGLAVKYEKILPYLPSTSRVKPEGAGAEQNSASKTDSFKSAPGLEFGFSFIEKFIQIPFRLPQPAEFGLAKLLDNISPIIGEGTEALSSAGSATDMRRDEGVLQPMQLAQSVGQKSSETGSPATLTSAKALTTEQEERRERIRIAVTKDSVTVRKVVQMVAPTLEYNPRRVKQFINMFRLNALIAAETGLFDVPKIPLSRNGLTLPQLGKFVAINLKWPRLLSDLDEDPSLIKTLDDWACDRWYQINPLYTEWTTRPELKDLLSYGCLGTSDPFDPSRPPDRSRYSLQSTDIKSLLRISPPIART